MPGSAQPSLAAAHEPTLALMAFERALSMAARLVLLLSVVSYHRRRASDLQTRVSAAVLLRHAFARVQQRMVSAALMQMAMQLRKNLQARRVWTDVAIKLSAAALHFAVANPVNEALATVIQTCVSERRADVAAVAPCLPQSGLAHVALEMATMAMMGGSARHNGPP